MNPWSRAQAHIVLPGHQSHITGRGKQFYWLGVVFTRVPYYFGDLKGHLNLENSLQLSSVGHRTSIRFDPLNAGGTRLGKGRMWLSKVAGNLLQRSLEKALRTWNLTSGPRSQIRDWNHKPSKDTFCTRFFETRYWFIEKGTHPNR